MSMTDLHAAATASPAARRYAVLHVEDDDVDAASVGRALARDERFHLQRVANLTDAGAAMADGDLFDVVLLDLGLPESVGIETFLGFRRLFPDVPVVVASGNDDADVAVEAVRGGAEDFIPKGHISGRELGYSLLYAVERNGRRLAESSAARLTREIDAAHEVQRRLLPSEPPSVPGFDIAGGCWPAAECSGDLFDFYVPEVPAFVGPFSCREGRYLDLVVADVSGHGLGPALLMTSTRSTLRIVSSRHRRPAEILEETSRHIYADTRGQRFVTCFYARLDTHHSRLDYAGAGHTAILISADGRSEILRGSGPPLGFAAESRYGRSRRKRLRRGDRLVVVTDGVFEAEGSDGTRLGIDAVAEFVRERRESSEETIDAIRSRVLDHAAGGTCHDDMTVLVVRRL